MLRSCIGQHAVLRAAQNFVDGPFDGFAQDIKDLIPLFTAAKWDPGAWAALFRKTGPRLVMGMAQHHETSLCGTAMSRRSTLKEGAHIAILWASSARRFVKQGVKFGVSNYHFTTKGDILYAIALSWPGGVALITSLATGKAAGTVGNVTHVGRAGSLEFTQDRQGLKVKLPKNGPDRTAWMVCEADVSPLNLN